MKLEITDIKATTVSVPLKAALRHSNGCHWGRFVRTIVEVHTDQGIVGLGEMGGGGESAEAAFRSLLGYLKGHDPFDLEALRWKIANPTASLYNDRTQLLAAIEFACLDIAGRALDVPLHSLLGGKLRDEVEFASYLFFTYPVAGEPIVDVRTPDQLVAHARQLQQDHGFTGHKLKGGVFSPDHELDCYLALADAFPGDRIRFDPNGIFGLGDALRFGHAIEGLNNGYYEDPTWGLNGMRQLRERINIPLATNTVVVNFEQLAVNILDPALDVILLDTTFWGGIRPCIKAAGICETFQQQIAVHSSGELGIQLATMLHLGAVPPKLTFAADAHYHHLCDDIIVGGAMPYRDGRIAIPGGPGLGVELDREKLGIYAEEYERHGGYAYDRDPGRPDWYALNPGRNWADPGLELSLERGSRPSR